MLNVISLVITGYLVGFDHGHDQVSIPATYLSTDRMSVRFERQLYKPFRMAQK